MLSERRDNGTPKTEMETQLAFHDGDRGKQDKDGDEVVLPTWEGKVKPHIRCNRCRKRGHYANRCPLQEMKEAISAFGIESSDDKGYDSKHSNKFIYLTTKHKGVNQDMLLLSNQSTTNIMRNGKYVHNICRVNKALSMHYFKYSTQTNMMCNVPGYGKAWFHKKGAVNILSLAKVKQRY
eukprot:6950602-Ditylum_brightwellii.AAC.1